MAANQLASLDAWEKVESSCILETLETYEEWEGVKQIVEKVEALLVIIWLIKSANQVGCLVTLANLLIIEGGSSVWMIFEEERGEESMSEAGKGKIVSCMSSICLKGKTFS